MPKKRKPYPPAFRRLRKANRQLRLEREILAKAAAWFAQEAAVNSKRSSS